VIQLSLTAVLASSVVLLVLSITLSVVLCSACAAKGAVVNRAPNTVAAIMVPYRMGSSSLELAGELGLSC